MKYETDEELSAALALLDKAETADDFYDRLAEQLESEPIPTPVRRTFFGAHWMSFAATSAAAVAVVAVVASTLPTENKPQIAQPPTTQPLPTTQPEPINPTLASQVAELAEARYATLKGLSGTSTFRRYCPTIEPYGPMCEPGVPEDPNQTTQLHWKLSSNGSFVITDPNTLTGKPSDTVSYYTRGYDATARVATVISNQVDYETKVPKLSAYETSNALPGDPYHEITGHFSLRNLLNGIELDKSATLEHITIDGKAAYSIHAKGGMVDQFGITPDESHAVFDKETLFPISLKEFLKGKLLKEIRISNLVVDPAFKPLDFRPAAATSLAITLDDEGWKHFDTIEAAAAAVSYRPLAPSYVPEGYVLTDVFSKADAGASGAEGSNPENRDLVIATYRRGLQSIEFTTRLTGMPPHGWFDPYSYEGDSNSRSVKVTVNGGAYNDLTAENVAGFGITPHIWIKGSTVVTAIIGDATSEELLRMLESTDRIPTAQ